MNLFWDSDSPSVRMVGSPIMHAVRWVITVKAYKDDTVETIVLRPKKPIRFIELESLVHENLRDFNPTRVTFVATSS